MTKKLEELFNLGDSNDEDAIGPIQEPIETGLINQETLATIEKIENALPEVKGLQSSDNEMDEIADLAKESFNNLMDLGMQVDSRFSAEIFSVASTMLGHALTAKTSKMQKKLKMIDLQLKKAELDRKLAATKDGEPEKTPLGTAQVIDRNELLKMISQGALAKNGGKDK